jgi:sirohydrochlorin ferrochelatase
VPVSATLLVAAHGTRSALGSATTRALVEAIATARPSVAVRLCFLDVAAPSLAEALDALDALDAGEVVVVPLLLSSGYHVVTDIPAVAAARRAVRVAAHLGPDPAVVDAVSQRLSEARSAGPVAATTVLAAIASSQASARSEVSAAAAMLSDRLGREVTVLPLSGELATAVEALPAPIEAAVYLLAEGGFLSSLRSAVAGRGVVAEPIGVHRALVSLVWSRYDAAARPGL